MSVPLSVWSTLMDRKNVYESLQVIAHFGLTQVYFADEKKTKWNECRQEKSWVRVLSYHMRMALSNYKYSQICWATGFRGWD